MIPIESFQLSRIVQRHLSFSFFNDIQYKLCSEKGDFSKTN